MNLFIYVLLLSISIRSCFNGSQSNVSSTVGAKQLQSMETNLDSFRRRLLVIVVGIMIMSFVFTCLCFLHHNCMSDNATNGDIIRKQGIAAKPSRLSPSESKTASPCSPEKQPLLSCTDKLSEPSSQKKSSRPSSVQKLLRPTSPEKSPIPSSAEKLPRPASSGKLCGPPSRKSSRPSSPEQLFRSSHLQKPYKLIHTRSINKTDTLSRPLPSKTCRCYKEKCLVCKTSPESSEIKNNFALTPPFLSEVKCLSQSFHKEDSMGNTIFYDASDDDDDSDREITIICNIKQKEAHPRATQNS
ncbi:uncharacterized protein CXorf66 homolog [Orycteropus afer afer]|uniref:Uncharacterized protein CXorf66 homolog n=1 Tax=Orycteropus afer afer TaxID=1230840 RepID=A0AC54Z5N1_ORYAF|nr:uncharacterized protein CXorf66 homolog [Orycteropus afer afer]